MTLRDERGGDRINRAKVVLIGAGDTDLQKKGGKRFNVIPKRKYHKKNILPNELRVFRSIFALSIHCTIVVQYIMSNSFSV